MGGLSGCVTELTLPDPKADRKLVLLGELVADDTLSLRLGQSTPVTQGSVALPPDPTGLSIDFRKENTPVATLVPHSDGRTPGLQTLLISAPLHIFSGSRYSIQVAGGRYPFVAATVQIPHPFVAAIIDTTTVPYAGGAALRVLFRIYDLGGENNFYSVEALRQRFSLAGHFIYDNDTFDLIRDKPLYDSLRAAGQHPIRRIDTSHADVYERLPIYTNDALTENLKVATPYTVSQRILLTDNGFAGGRHDLQIYVPADRLRGSFPNDMGRILFTVKSLTPEYFGYLRAYETFTPATSTGYLAQPVRIESNVVGGLGVVGGCFRVPFYFTFDPDPF